MSKYKSGDLVRITKVDCKLGHHGLPIGDEVTLGKRIPMLDKTAGAPAWCCNDRYINENEFELVEDEWSPWEPRYLTHPYYNDKVEQQRHITPGKPTMYRFKVPKRVKVSELTGSVQMVGGKPIWSTYKE